MKNQGNNSLLSCFICNPSIIDTDYMHTTALREALTAYEDEVTGGRDNDAYLSAFVAAYCAYTDALSSTYHHQNFDEATHNTLTILSAQLAKKAETTFTHQHPGQQS